jgi:hypothetical protein
VKDRASFAQIILPARTGINAGEIPQLFRHLFFDLFFLLLEATRLSKLTPIFSPDFSPFFSRQTTFWPTPLFF